MERTLILLSLLALISSCGSRSINVDFHLPTQQFLTPETTGEPLGVKGSLNAHHSHKVSLARTSQSSTIFSSSPGDVDIQTDPKGDNSFGLGLNGAVGLWERIDFIVEKSNEAPWNGGLLFQIVGPTDRKAQGFRLAIAGMAGYQSDREFASDDFGSSSSESEKFDNVKARTILRNVGASLLFGYRRNERILGYVNIHHQTVEVESHINIEGGQNSNLDADVENYGANVGIKVNFGGKSDFVFFQSELGFSRAKIQGALEENNDLATWAFGLGMEY